MSGKKPNQPFKKQINYDGPAYQPRGSNMGMRMEMGGPGYGLLQVMRLSPPIANTEEQIKSHAKPRVTKEISDTVLDGIKEIVSLENPDKPYKDSEIFDYLKEKGLEVSKREITLGRLELGIKPSALRYKK